MTGGLLRGLRGDADRAALLADGATLAAMARVEAARARAQAASGVIPEAGAAQIARTAEGLQPDPEALVPAAAQSGIAAQPLTGALKAAAGDAAGFVHHGATSQDIVDSALALHRAETALQCLARDAPRAGAKALLARALRRLADDPALTLAAALAELAPGAGWHRDLDPARLAGHAPSHQGDCR